LRIACKRGGEKDGVVFLMTLVERDGEKGEKIIALLGREGRIRKRSSLYPSSLGKGGGKKSHIYAHSNERNSTKKKKKKTLLI